MLRRSTEFNGLCRCGCGQKTNISRWNNRKFGWVKGQPFRFILGHSANVKPKRPLDERFWEKVDKNGPMPTNRPELGQCWVWLAATGPTGYGQIFVNGRLHPAHRISYILSGKEVPDGLDMDHLCRNHACVNPNHLEPVTQRINTLRGIGPTAVNAKKEFCKRGHALTGSNVFRRSTRPNQRECRMCVRFMARVSYARRTANEKQ